MSTTQLVIVHEHRKKALLNQILNHGEKGCGNCRFSRLDPDLTVECYIYEEKYEPDYKCPDNWRKDIKIATLHRELQLNPSDVKFNVGASDKHEDGNHEL